MHSGLRWLVDHFRYCSSAQSALLRVLLRLNRLKVHVKAARYCQDWLRLAPSFLAAGGRQSR